MMKRDRLSDAEIENSLETLLADCDDALARGEDPTALLERLRDLPAEARQQFNEAYESLRSVKNMLPARVATVHFPRPFGKFRLLQLLGQGGFGLVFLAEDAALGRKVALKLPRLHQLVATESSERFAREARAAAALEHPHLVPIFEIGQAEGLTYLASAYCEGPTLSQWLKAQNTPVPIRAAAELVEMLARAASHMHGQGVVHRDLKPSNVLLFPKKSTTVEDASNSAKTLDAFIPKITDFGLARQNDCVLELTRTGMMLGTAVYMAPEQAWGSSKDIGPAADIYALGVILYELLTGWPPFHGDNDLETLQRAREEEPVPPRKLRSGTPRDLDTICLKCLEKQPGRRYVSMPALADDLQRFLQGRAIAAQRTGWVDRTSKWVRRQPLVAGLTSLALVLVAALVAGSIWFGRREYQHGQDLEATLKETQDQRKLVEEGEWQERNQQYASQIRAGWFLKKDGHWAALRDLLLDLSPGPDQKDVRSFEWHYLWRAGEGFMLPQHKARVTAVAYSNSGNVCASGSLDGEIHLYDQYTGKRLTALSGHGFAVNTLSFLNDDTQLLSTAFDKNPAGPGFRAEFILWSLAESKILRRGVYSHSFTYRGHPVFAPAPAARALFVIDRNRDPHQLLRLDLNTGVERVLLTSDNSYLVATSPTADRLAIVSYPPHHDGKRHPDFVEIFDASMRRIAARRFDKPVHMAGFSADGQHLALGVGLDDMSRFVEIRDAASMRLNKSIPFAQIPGGLRFDSQGARLALMTGQTHLHFFEVPSGSSVGTFKHDSAHDLAVAFSPDGKELALGEGDGRVHTGLNPFMPQDDVLPGPLPTSEAWCLAFAPDGRTLAVGYDHVKKEAPETLTLWDLKTRKPKLLAGHKSTVMALAFSPDGSMLATASYDCSVCLWDMVKGKLQGEIKEHVKPVRALAFSPDGRQIASGGTDQSIKIWNVKDQLITKSWRAHDDMIRALTFSLDGAFLISAANDCDIKVWNAKNQSLLRTIGDKSHVQGLAFSPKGTLLASAHENNKIYLWDVAKAVAFKTLLGHTGKVRCVAFSPDANTLASGGEDKTVRLWNVVTGQELLTFPVDHFINNLAFDRDGKTLAAALHNGKVKIWKAD
jgi:WD40 repeat protein/tRNA A-37 threonylcarbamoyl transferase component Bud32